MISKKQAGSSQKRRTFSRMQSGIVLLAVGIGLFAGCANVPNPAKRLVNHVSTKTSEARLRDKVEKDQFPTAQEAGLD
ncbi:MAG: hypothetical protein IT426_02300 [Pirellulales bacterium]|nr:hypothetical protein [Pirellulales bacterium]